MNNIQHNTFLFPKRIIPFLLCIIAGLITGYLSGNLFPSFQTMQDMNEHAVTQTKEAFHAENVSVTKARLSYQSATPYSFFGIVFFPNQVVQNYESALQIDSSFYSVLNSEKNDTDHQQSLSATEELNTLLKEQFGNNATGTVLSRNNGKHIQYYLLAQTGTDVSEALAELVRGTSAYGSAEDAVLYYAEIANTKLASDTVEILKFFQSGYEILPNQPNSYISRIKKNRIAPEVTIILKGGN